MEAFLAHNFYKKQNLERKNVKYGHWSNRRYRDGGNPYGVLFGSHLFHDSVYINRPCIYIYRDGRSVAFSIWKTEGFLNQKHKGISFSDFLRLKLDFHGSPSTRVPFPFSPQYNIAQHWYYHVDGWMVAARANKNILVVRYEELHRDFVAVYNKIHKTFFSGSKKLRESEIDPIKFPLGLLPNEGGINSWRSAFSLEDELFFKEGIPMEKYLDLE